MFLYLSEAKSVHIVISVFSARGANLEDEQQRKYEQEQLTLPQFFEPAPSCISFFKNYYLVVALFFLFFFSCFFFCQKKMVIDED